VILAVNFWTGSRYPSLEGKALMGGSTRLDDPLSFESKFVVSPGDPIYKKVMYTTVNWASTNRQGMTFGVLFGAAFLTFFSLLRKRSYKSSMANTLLGLVTGTPLGVCVNCAAPIAKGMHDAGARLETTLATMFSSPTLNIIVLTMVFSIFPIYLALIKLGLTLVFIVLLIPLMARYLFREDALATHDAACCIVDEPLVNASSESWVQALMASAGSYLKNLWWIVYKTVPLMLLAGFLGAFMITVVPLESLAGHEITILLAISLALLGVFIPCPIALDIVISASLLSAGVPIFYVMILLFTLGTYSIYSFMIIWTSISKRVAIVLYLVVALVGILAGTVAQYWHEIELRKMLEIFSSEVQAAEMPAGGNIDFTVFEKSSPAGARAFTRVEGYTWGLDVINDFSVEDFWPPFYNGRGVASGDYDNDGWTDILFAAKHGVVLFHNEAGKSFTQVNISIPELTEMNTFLVSLVDINNDGWLDIYLTAYHSGIYYMISDKGDFLHAKLERAPGDNAVLTEAVSFGDIDHDGDLDAAIGNWFYGFAKQAPTLASTNVLHINNAGVFSEKKIDGITGETLSILLSDFNHDQNLDLIVGNDFQAPDLYYLGDGKGGFSQITKEDSVIPISTLTTMSIDTGDVNNDLNTDIYIAQIAARASGRAVKIDLRPMRDYCKDITDIENKKRCSRNVAIRSFFAYGPRHKPTDIKKCAVIEDKAERRTCMSMKLMVTATREKNPDICKSIPADQKRASWLCTSFFEPPVATTYAEFNRSITQRPNQNVLLLGAANRKFEDHAVAMDVDISGWSWNAKFADLDNDGWQDIYVVNGAWVRPGFTPSNFFFYNQKGKGFAIKDKEFGLGNYMIEPSYTYIDIENDGDLDIIATTVNGPVWLYINNQSANNSVAVELRDQRGNHYGIGSRIVLNYGKDQHQMREIKSGGGFLSFDAPVAYFGLGQEKMLKSIDVFWSTGEKTTYEGPFKVNGKYRIERRKL